MKSKIIPAASRIVSIQEQYRKIRHLQTALGLRRSADLPTAEAVKLLNAEKRKLQAAKEAYFPPEQ